MEGNRKTGAPERKNSVRSGSQRGSGERKSSPTGKSAKKISTQEWRIDIPIYSKTVVVIVGENEEEILYYAESYYDYDRFDDCCFNGLSVHLDLGDEDGFGIFIVHSELEPGLVAHEAYHTVKKIMSNVGIMNEEAEAYLLDYLVRQIHLALNL